MILLLTWVWQGLAIAFATGAVLASTRRLNAATRHVIWWATCAAVLALPAAHLAAGLLPGAPAAASPPPAPAALPLPAAPGWLLPILAIGWAALVLARGVGIARSVAAVGRLKRLSQPLEPARAARLGMWRTARPRRRPRLHVSSEARGACALGFLRPIILVSRPLVEALDDDDLDEIVMHECAHLERYDDWTQLLQAAVTAVAGWHPAIAFVGRGIRFEREAACDDRVVARTGAPRDYARSLVEAAALGGEPGLSAIPGVCAARSALRRRVHRLLDPLRARGSRVKAWSGLAGIALLAVSVGGAVRIPAMIVLVESAVALPDTPAADWPDSARSLVRVAPAHVPDSRVARAARPDAPDASEVVPATALARSTATPPVIAPSTARAAASRSAPGPESPAPQVPPTGRVTIVADPAPAPLASTPSTGPWTTLAQSGVTVGRAVGRAGAATGDGAKEAGLSLSRFFSRAGKTVAGRF